MAKKKNGGADAPETELDTTAEVSGTAPAAGDEAPAEAANEEAKIPDSAAEPPASGAPSAGADPESKPQDGDAGAVAGQGAVAGLPTVPREPTAGLPDSPPAARAPMRLRERDEVDVEPIRLPELPVAPLSKPGYVPRHLDVHLNPRQSEALRALYLGLDATDTRMLDGPHVKSGGDAVRFLLDLVAVQIERNQLRSANTKKSK